MRKKEKRKEKEKKEERMTDNEIGDEGAKALSEMLKVNTTLKRLNLSCEKERKKERKKEERITNDRQSD